jgi:putative membrane protein insertion efficiency factor
MKRFMMAGVRFYRRHISPKFPPTCKFYPTCSEYALTALERYGALRGGLMTLWRIIRCSPLTAGGYDPVPPKKEIYYY